VAPFPTRRSSDLYNDLRKSTVLLRFGQFIWNAFEQGLVTFRQHNAELVEQSSQGVCLHDTHLHQLRAHAMQRETGLLLFAFDGYRSYMRLLCCYPEDRKSTRLNSSHVKISYAVFC